MTTRRLKPWGGLLVRGGGIITPGGGLMPVAGTGVVAIPVGFTWDPGFTITRVGSAFTTDIDTESLKPATTATYYVDRSRPDDAGNGLTPGTAFRSLTTAVTAINTGGVSATVNVSTGIYGHTQTTYLTGTLTESTVWIATDGAGTVSSVAAQTTTWTPHATFANVWQTNRSATTKVIDEGVLNTEGAAGTWLTLQASVEDVRDNAGSWHTAANVVYVHTADSRTADADVMPMIPIVAFGLNDATKSLYMEGFDFKGMPSGTNIAACAQATFVDCKFLYSESNGLDADNGIYRVVRCSAHENNQDGFNYHTSGAGIFASEEDCLAYGNGHNGAHNNNGTTMHDGGSAVRVNGDYQRSDGPNVVDVNDSEGWCLGTNAQGSHPDTTGTQSANFLIDGDMWLDNCVSADAINDRVVVAGGTMLTYQFTAGVGFDTNDGTLGTYLP